jgi:hypothetical protein
MGRQMPSRQRRFPLRGGDLTCPHSRGRDPPGRYRLDDNGGPHAPLSARRQHRTAGLNIEAPARRSGGATPQPVRPWRGAVRPTGLAGRGARRQRGPTAATGVPCGHPRRPGRSAQEGPGTGGSGLDAACGLRRARFVQPLPSTGRVPDPGWVPATATSTPAARSRRSGSAANNWL